MQTKWNARPENFNLINKSPWHGMWMLLALPQGCVHWKWKWIQEPGHAPNYAATVQTVRRAAAAASGGIEDQSKTKKKQALFGF